MTTEQLSRDHERTLQTIFQHPVAHNLAWRQVVTLLEAIGTVQEEHNGHYLMTVGEQTHDMHRPRHKDLADIAELLALRHFLERAGITPTDPQHSAPEAAAVDHSHMLVVIDHKETRVYAAVFKGTQPERLHPYDPLGELQHLHHTDGHFQGQRVPEDPRYYAAIAALVQDAGAILLFGNGTGKASAMVQLVRYLTKHHLDIADRIVGAIVVDVEALSENQLLAEARAFYADEVGVAAIETK